MDKYTQQLENIIKQMLTPLKNIPFNMVIESISGFKVIKFNESDKKHKAILSKLKKVAVKTCIAVNTEGIRRSRPNEVGNDIEPYVIDSFISCNIKAEKPKTKSGKNQSVGYPDIEIIINAEEKHYVECKTYSKSTIGSSMRSFYLSPSEDFKVTHDAIHFIMGFEIYADSRIGKDTIYKTKGWKILDACRLDCDVKHEFNSDNARLYQPSMVLAAGRI